MNRKENVVVFSNINKTPSRPKMLEKYGKEILEITSL